MTMKTMKFALTAVAVLGAGAATAQEMGEIVAQTVPAPVAPAPAVAVPAAPVAAAPIAAAPAQATPEDAGPQIVAENQKFAPTAKASKSVDANTAVMTALRQRGFRQGYDPERGSIIQIGQAVDNVDDPASPDFMTVRELLVRQAELDAKIQIAGVVRRQMNGSTRQHARYAGECGFSPEVRRQDCGSRTAEGEGRRVASDA